jgi:hypothetical protein
MAIQWLTTAPNPKSQGTGWDAGQRGWRVHAIDVPDEDPRESLVTFKDIANTRSACGLLPVHGWGMDLFIERRCMRCEIALGLGLSAENRRAIEYKKERRQQLKADGQR